MKNLFAGYYQPTPEEYSRIWEEALIILDTNVLLSLYKLPVSARNEVIGVLEKLKKRLWIPYHVALEFQRGRLSVIANEHKAVDDVLISTNNLISEVKEKFNTLQIDKRDLGIDCNSLIEELDKASEQLVQAIKKAHNSQLDISSSDPIRSRIDKLISESIGNNPTTQSELEQLIIDGETRFDNKIPPGFKDADKSKNPADTSFIFDGLKYQRKFGDLIIWRQIINHAKEKGIKSVLFITADNKEDWWWREQGKTIGPRQELVREILQKAGVELFWMYSSVQFVEQANKYVSAKVSESAVNELQNVILEYDSKTVSNSINSHSYYLPTRTIYDKDETRKSSLNLDAKLAEQAVGRWLSYNEEFIEKNWRFPDFLVKRDNGLHGYEVRLISRFDRKNISSPIITNALLKGYVEMGEGRLNTFTLIIIIPESDFFRVNDLDMQAEISSRIEQLLERYPVYSIMVGTIIDGDFMTVFIQKSNNRNNSNSNPYLE